MGKRASRSKTKKKKRKAACAYDGANYKLIRSPWSSEKIYGSNITVPPCEMSLFSCSVASYFFSPLTSATSCLISILSQGPQKQWEIATADAEERDQRARRRMCTVLEQEKSKKKNERQTKQLGIYLLQRLSRDNSEKGITSRAKIAWGIVGARGLVYKALWKRGRENANHRFIFWQTQWRVLLCKRRWDEAKRNQTTCPGHILLSPLGTLDPMQEIKLYLYIAFTSPCLFICPSFFFFF